MWTNGPVAPVGLLVPIPTLPLFVMRNLSTPSVSTTKWPPDPVSITSAFVLPSLILSESIPVKFEPSPLNVVAVITPVTSIPCEFEVTAEPTTMRFAVAVVADNAPVSVVEPPT